MKKKLVVLLTCLSVLLTGCGRSTMDSTKSISGADTSFNLKNVAVEDGTYEEAAAVDDEGADITNVDGKKYERKLVYNCDLSIETLSYEQTIADIKQAITKVSGFIQNESSYNRNRGSETSRNCNLVVRVPADKYQAFLDEISQTGSVTNMNASVENITQEYYDTKTRIDALKIQEERLLTMMSECETVADMITVEDRLTEVQSELARYQTSLDLMQNEVDYSTITIDIDEVSKVTVHEDTFWDNFLDTVDDSWEVFTNVLITIGKIIIYLLPFSVVAGVILWVIHICEKNRKVKKQQKKEEVSKKGKNDTKEEADK